MAIVDDLFEEEHGRPSRDLAEMLQWVGTAEGRAILVLNGLVDEDDTIGPWDIVCNAGRQTD
jgi:hypothetical protein